MYDDGFATRIDEIVQKIGGIGKACEQAGISYPTLGRWKDGTSDPKLSNIKALAKVAGVSVDWLVFGDNTTLAQPVQQLQPANDDEYAYIPAYDIAVSAGHGMFSDGAVQPSKHLAFRKRWVQARNLDPKCLAVLFTEGDSMTPTIPESAAIVIDRERTTALDGKVYVIRIDERLYVKRTQWILGGGLRLISDNKFYDPQDITKEDLQASDIEVCGQVIHACYDLPD